MRGVRGQSSAPAADAGAGGDALAGSLPEADGGAGGGGRSGLAARGRWRRWRRRAERALSKLLMNARRPFFRCKQQVCPQHQIQQPDPWCYSEYLLIWYERHEEVRGEDWVLYICARCSRGRIRRANHSAIISSDTLKLTIEKIDRSQKYR